MLNNIKISQRADEIVLNVNIIAELNEIIDTKVVGLLRYNTFEELFKDFDIEILADKTMTKKQLLETLERFYTKDKQSKYGVVGIKIEKI